MRKLKLFITGIGGLAGRALAKYVLSKNYSVGGTIHKNLPKDYNYQTLLEYYTVDLKNLDETKKVFKDFQPDVVIHLAGKAFGRLDNQTINPHSYTENMTIFQNVLTAIKNLSNTPRFILTSGCLVYSTATSNLISEIHPKFLPKIDPKKEPYRAGKLDQERILAEEKIDYVIARPTQFTGPGKIKGTIEWYLAQDVSEIIAGKTKQITVMNKLSEIDLLDVRDLANAILTLTEKGLTGEVYHICSGVPITVEQLAKTFLEVVGFNPSRYTTKSTGIEQTNYFRFSSAKINNLGWFPKHTLQEALLSYWEYFKNQEKNEQS